MAEFDCFDHVSVIGLSVVNLYKMSNFVAKIKCLFVASSVVGYS